MPKSRRCSCSPCRRGSRCCKGRKGSKGSRGSRGSQGSKGCPGERGPKGRRGSKGSRGRRGHDGPTGPTGMKGNTGATGPTGMDGPSGPTGLDGPTGPTGPGVDAGPFNYALDNDQSVNVGSDLNPIIFDHPIVSNGNFNPVTGIYTVPISGTYFFNATVHVGWNLSDSNPINNLSLGLHVTPSAVLGDPEASDIKTFFIDPTNFSGTTGIDGMYITHMLPLIIGHTVQVGLHNPSNTDVSVLGRFRSLPFTPAVPLGALSHFQGFRIA